MEQCIPLLNRCFLFRHLQDADLRKIAKEIKLIGYKKGSKILAQNEPGHSLYIIVSGVAKVTMHDQHGRTNTLAYLNSCDAFGEISVFAGTNSTADVTAFSDLTLIVLSKPKVKKLLKSSPNLSYNIIRTLCEHIRDNDQLIDDLAFKNLEGRIAAKLLNLAGKFGEKTGSKTVITLSLTHSDIGELAGTSRETATKILGAFKKEGCIEMKDKQIVITNSTKLTEWTKR